MDGKKDIRRVLAHERMDFVPDTYGERRDSERLKASNLLEWPIEQEVRTGGPAERWQGAPVRRWQGLRCGLIRCSLAPVRPGSGKSRENKKTPIKGRMPGTSLYLACYEKVICKPMAGSHLIYSMF